MYENQGPVGQGTTTNNGAGTRWTVDDTTEDIYDCQENEGGSVNSFELVPKALTSTPQWVCWCYVYKGKKNPDGSEKPDKVPYCPGIPYSSRKAAKSTEPLTWGTFDSALSAYMRGGYDGIGFVVTKDDDFCGIDIDECVKDGIISEYAMSIVMRMNSYTEISPSGTGLRIFLIGKKPGRRCKNKVRGIEIYDSDRYFTITGNHLHGTPYDVEPRQAELEELYTETFGTDEGTEQVDGNEGSEDFSNEPDDTVILQYARNARNGLKFQRLWDGDISEYNDDDSAADIALCCMLAYWTRDPERMDRLFRQSRLCRDKWLDRHDYRQRTIDAALKTVTTYYDWSGNRKGMTRESALQSIELIFDNPSGKCKTLEDVLEDTGLIDALVYISLEHKVDFEKVLVRLGNAKWRAKDVAALGRAINGESREQKKSRRTQTEPDISELISILEILPDAPVSTDVVLPPGYGISYSGVAKTRTIFSRSGHPREVSETVAPSAILICARMKDITTGQESLRLCWYRDGRWQFHMTNRAIVADSRKIVLLAEYGFPVNSITAKNVVTYIGEFEAYNTSALPPRKMTCRLGWQGEEGFLIGNILIAPDGRRIDIKGVESDT